MKPLIPVLALALTPLCAQEPQFPPALDRLADKATEAVEVTLDAQLLQLAARFLSNREPDEAKVKQLVSGLKGIYVRSYKFAQPGQYSKADIQALRSEVRGPGWQPMVVVKSLKDGENADIYIRTENGKVAGMMIIAEEPKELTIVKIAGEIDPDQLADLGGHFGIPEFERRRGKD